MAVDPQRYETRVWNALDAGEVKPLPGWERWFMPALHCRGRLPDHWPDRRRPEGEHPEKMAAFTGDFDGNPVAAPQPG